MTQNSDTQIDEQVVRAIFSGLENGDGRAFGDVIEGRIAGGYLQQARQGAS
jgi:hypothetical protein